MSMSVLCGGGGLGGAIYSALLAVILVVVVELLHLTQSTVTSAAMTKAAMLVCGVKRYLTGSEFSMCLFHNSYYCAPPCGRRH